MKQSLITSIITFAFWSPRLPHGKRVAKRLLTVRGQFTSAGVGTSQLVTPSRGCVVIGARCDGHQRPHFPTTQAISRASGCRFVTIPIVTQHNWYVVAI